MDEVEFKKVKLHQSSRFIRSRQLRQNSSITISQLHRSCSLMSSIMSQCQSHHGSCQRQLSTSFRTLRSDSQRGSSRSFDQLILIWKMCCSQEENSSQTSRSWISIARSLSWTCTSICGNSKIQPQWKSMSQSSSVARRPAQVQVQARSSRSTQEGSPLAESAHVRRTCVGHSGVPQVQSQHSVSQLGQRKNSLSSSTEKQNAQFIS